jgi:chromosome segregation ATPase
MDTLLLVLILLGALLALVGAIVAIRAWLGFRRTRRALQNQLSEDVAHLAARTTEMEERLASLDARAQQLPVRISELQRNLTTLQILTGALSTSLRQAQRALSYTELKNFSSARLSNFLKTRSR